METEATVCVEVANYFNWNIYSNRNTQMPRPWKFRQDLPNSRKLKARDLRVDQWNDLL